MNKSMSEEFNETRIIPQGIGTGNSFENAKARNSYEITGQQFHTTPMAARTVHVIPAKAVHPTARTNTTHKRRVCAYCRVSTEEESQATSYDLQISHYEDYIKKNPTWQFQGIYADEGISGTSTKNRTQFQQMIKDCLDGKIDYIITKSISRFARNTLDCLQYVRQLKNLPSPVGIYFEKENIDTLDSKCELILTILSSLAQDESRSISENAKWGVQKRFQQGKAFFPTANFLGYDKDENGQLIINEQEADTVRRIYREFLQGSGTEVIARGLKKDGLLTGRGNTNWSGNSVLLVLKNEKYCGDILMQKRVTLDYLTHKQVWNRGHQPQYFIPDHHPAIISKEDWYAVQAELKRRHQMQHDPENKYHQSYSCKSPFSNRLYCAVCGRPVVRLRNTSRRGGEKYIFTAWLCRVKLGRDAELKTCKAKYFWESDLEEAFMRMLQDMKENRSQLIRKFEAVIKAKSLTPAEKERLGEVEGQLRAIRERMKELSLMGSTMNSDIYDATSNQLVYEQGILQGEWENLMSRQQKSVNMRKHMDALLEELDALKDRPVLEREKPRRHHEPCLDFRGELFIKIIRLGKINFDGWMEYELKCGVVWKVRVERVGGRKGLTI